MNQTIEQYLCIHCNYQQDDWFAHLSLAEFVNNNAFQSTIRCSPFYANYGYHSKFQIKLGISTDSAPRVDVPAAKDLAERLLQHHEALVENIKQAQDSQARYYDSQHKRIEFSIGDKVWLLSANIRTERPSKKLDWKRLGPYTIIQRVGLQAYRLELPPSIRVHPVFHVSLLEPYTISTIPGRIRPPSPLVVVNDDGLEYEIEAILDSAYRRSKLYYKIQWKGYPISEDSWKPTSNRANAPHVICDFHACYPHKPGPKSRLQNQNQNQNLHESHRNRTKNPGIRSRDHVVVSLAKLHSFQQPLSRCQFTKL